MALKPPTKTDVKEPVPSDVSVSYRDWSGLRGCKGQNHILQSDNKSNPGVAIQSKTGNIYLDASNKMQQTATTCVHSIKALTQYIDEIEKNVYGKASIHIWGSEHV
jgi:hypothetical protein